MNSKLMEHLFAIELNLSPLTTGAIVVSAFGFIVMFGIASAKGGFEDLVKTTLENDDINRKKAKSQK